MKTKAVRSNTSTNQNPYPFLFLCNYLAERLSVLCFAFSCTEPLLSLHRFIGWLKHPFWLSRLCEERQECAR